jgi:hypothetical protein
LLPFLFTAIFSEFKEVLSMKRDLVSICWMNK